MFKKCIQMAAYCFQNSRAEFHSALTVLVFAGVFGVIFCVFNAALYLFDWHYSINYELLGYIVGLLGLGELARGFSKLYIIKSENYRNIIATTIAGATVGAIFSTLMILKWHYELISIFIGIVISASLYLSMHGVLLLEAKKQNKV
jgi:cyanate permease